MCLRFLIETFIHLLNLKLISNLSNSLFQTPIMYFTANINSFFTGIYLRSFRCICALKCQKLF